MPPRNPYIDDEAEEVGGSDCSEHEEGDEQPAMDDKEFDHFINDETESEDGSSSETDSDFEESKKEAPPEKKQDQGLAKVGGKTLDTRGQKPKPEQVPAVGEFLSKCQQIIDEPYPGADDDQSSSPAKDLTELTPPPTTPALDDKAPADKPHGSEPPQTENQGHSSRHVSQAQSRRSFDGEDTNHDGEKPAHPEGDGSTKKKSKKRKRNKKDDEEDREKRRQLEKSRQFDLDDEKLIVRRRLRGRFNKERRSPGEVERDAIRIAFGFKNHREVCRFRKELRGVIGEHVDITSAWSYHDEESLTKAINAAYKHFHPQNPSWTVGMFRKIIVLQLRDSSKNDTFKSNGYTSRTQQYPPRAPRRGRLYYGSTTTVSPTERPGAARTKPSITNRDAASEAGDDDDSSADGDARKSRTLSPGRNEQKKPSPTLTEVRSTQSRAGSLDGEDTQSHDGSETAGYTQSRAGSLDARDTQPHAGSERQPAHGVEGSIEPPRPSKFQPQTPLSTKVPEAIPEQRLAMDRYNDELYGKAKDCGHKKTCSSGDAPVPSMVFDIFKEKGEPQSSNATLSNSLPVVRQRLESSPFYLKPLPPQVVEGNIGSSQTYASEKRMGRVPFWKDSSPSSHMSVSRSAQRSSRPPVTFQAPPPPPAVLRVEFLKSPYDLTPIVAFSVSLFRQNTLAQFLVSVNEHLEHAGEECFDMKHVKLLYVPMRNFSRVLATAGPSWHVCMNFRDIAHMFARFCENGGVYMTSCNTVDIMSGRLKDVLADEDLDMGYVRLIKLEKMDEDEDDDRPYTLEDLKAMEFHEKIACFNNQGDFLRSYEQQLSVEPEDPPSMPATPQKVRAARHLSVLPISGGIRKTRASSTLPLSRHASRAASMTPMAPSRTTPIRSDRSGGKKSTNMPPPPPGPSKSTPAKPPAGSARASMFPPESLRADAAVAAVSKLGTSTSTQNASARIENAGLGPRAVSSTPSPTHSVAPRDVSPSGSGDGRSNTGSTKASQQVGGHISSSQVSRVVDSPVRRIEPKAREGQQNRLATLMAQVQDPTVIHSSHDLPPLLSHDVDASKDETGRSSKSATRLKVPVPIQSGDAQELDPVSSAQSTDGKRQTLLRFPVVKKAPAAQSGMEYGPMSYAPKRSNSPANDDDTRPSNHRPHFTHIPKLRSYPMGLSNTNQSGYTSPTKKIPPLRVSPPPPHGQPGPGDKQHGLAPTSRGTAGRQGQAGSPLNPVPVLKPPKRYLISPEATVPIVEDPPIAPTVTIPPAESKARPVKHLHNPTATTTNPAAIPPTLQPATTTNPAAVPAPHQLATRTVSVRGKPTDLTTSETGILAASQSLQQPHLHYTRNVRRTLSIVNPAALAPIDNSFKDYVSAEEVCMREFGIDASLPDEKISKRKRVVRDAVEDWWETHGYTPSIVDMNWKQFAVDAIMRAKNAQPKKPKKSSGASSRPPLNVTPPPGSANPPKQQNRAGRPKARNRSPPKPPVNLQPTSDEIVVQFPSTKSKCKLSLSLCMFIANIV
ncbi:hypothetical protein BJ508DRAFT_333526 [Ascobolus immersus RN42]|uniref:Uncharacterized protein n=1 Tax=Ascobolus immersus RN42 TaxID=1160509 RepID=A0A3N4HJH7_ASCIM|nr:hypothetical protein BJ508DRAFT_333526 [Ascobolus immersus RN42]